jgi:hypothetical protein
MSFMRWPDKTVPITRGGRGRRTIPQIDDEVATVMNISDEAPLLPADEG